VIKKNETNRAWDGSLHKMLMIGCQGSYVMSKGHSIATAPF
jgi:hypothetical protein